MWPSWIRSCHLSRVWGFADAMYLLETMGLKVEIRAERARWYISHCHLVPESTVVQKYF